MSRFACFAMLAFFGFVSLPERAAARPYYAWIDADRPTTASYAPTNFKSSFDAANTRIKRSATGQYRVDLGSLPEADGGNFQVQAYGVQTHFCSIAWPGDYIAEKYVFIYCYDRNGQFADTKFTLTYSVYGQGSPAVTNAAYALYSYDADDPWWFDRDDTRSFTTGSTIYIGNWGKTYLAGFIGLPLTRPNVRISASRLFDQHYCNFGGITDGGGVVIRCFDESGVPVHSTVSIAYDSRNVFSALVEAHATVDATGAVQSWYSDAGAAITAEKNGLFQGFYTVTMPNVGTPGKQDGVPQVVAQTSGESTRCMVWDWYTSAFQGTDVSVRCVTAAGDPAPSGFSISYVR